MALDLSSGVAASGAPGGSPSSAARETPRRTPRVIAVVHARSVSNLVAALAGVAAQSRQPDILVGVDCLGGALALPGRDMSVESGVDLELTTGEIKAVENQQAFVETFAELDPELLDDEGQATGELTPVEAFADDPLVNDPLVNEPMRDADGRRIVDQGSTQTIAVAAGSAVDVLAAHCDGVVKLPARASVNQAVEAALAWADAHPEGSADSGEVEDWVWLLDDFERASMKALELLLDQIKVSPSAAVVGAKHRAGATGRELVDVGLTTTRFGRIMSFVEPGEPDQGQRDHVTDTLAVPMSGMLIRREVWTALRGLDPALQRRTPTDAAVDLCRRVWLAGHRVVVQPKAVFTAPADHAATPASRSARTHRRLAGAALLALPLVVISVLGGAVLRLLLGLVAKEPLRALHHSAASVGPMLRPDRVIRARWRARQTRRLPRRKLDRLLASNAQTWRWQRERFARARPRLVSPAGVDVEPIRWGNLSVLAGLLAIASIAALHRIVGSDPFSSGSMPAVPSSLAATWRAATSSWVPAGLGQPGPADPLVSVLAVLGTPFASSRLAALVLLLVALPASGWAAWWAAGGLTRRRPVRLLTGLAWAGAPITLLALSRMTLPIVVIAVFLPIAVRCLGQAAATHVQRSAWAWAGLAGLALAPVASLPAMAAALGVMLAMLAARTRRLPIGFAALPAVALALPSLLAARSTPSLLFAEPGRVSQRTAVAAWSGLFGWADDPDTATGHHLAPLAHRLLDAALAGLGGARTVDLGVEILPYLLGALPLVLALLGLRVVPRGTPRGAVARTGWLIAACGVVLIWFSQQFVVGVTADGPVRATPTAGVLLSLAGLLIAGCAGWGVKRPRQPGFTAAAGRTAIAALIGVVAVLPLTAIFGWSSEQFLAPAATDVQPGARPPLPQVIVDAAVSPDQGRTVSVRAVGAAEPDAQLPDLQVNLFRSTGADITQQAAAISARRQPSDRADQALATALARTVRGDEDVRQVLAPFGVSGVVLLPSGDRVADARLAGNLDSAVGLAAVGSVDGVRAWRVDALSSGATAPDRPAAVQFVPTTVVAGPSWYAIASQNGRVDTALPKRSSGSIVLAERADGGWVATLNGERLTPIVVNGWAQGFRYDGSAGELTIEHTADWQRLIGWVQIIAIALAALLALPVRARAGGPEGNAR